MNAAEPLPWSSVRNARVTEWLGSPSSDVVHMVEDFRRRRDAPACSFLSEYFSTAATGMLINTVTTTELKAEKMS